MPGFGGQGVGRQGNGHLTTFLSLQLLLLAFFVLLTAMARFEGDRARRVIDSVQSAFGPLSTMSGRDAAGPSDSDALRTVREDIGRLVRTAIPLARIETTASAELMRIALPAETFFRPAEAGLKPAARLLLPRLVAALERRPAGYRYELEVRQPDDPLRALSLARSDALARALAEAGVPSESLSVAIARGEPDRIQFLILLRSGAEPSRLFEELAARP